MIGILDYIRWACRHAVEFEQKRDDIEVGLSRQTPGRAGRHFLRYCVEHFSKSAPAPANEELWSSQRWPIIFVPGQVISMAGGARDLVQLLPPFRLFGREHAIPYCPLRRLARRGGPSWRRNSGEKKYE